MMNPLYRKKARIEVLAYEFGKGYLVCNEGQYDDQWWISSFVFDDTYEKVEVE